MAGLQDVEWEKCFVEAQADPRLEREVKKAIGFSMPVVRYFTAVPWVVQSMAVLHPSRCPPVFASFTLAELIALVVSQDNSCRFCYATTRMTMRLMGTSDERIQELEHDLSAAPLSPAEKAALDFARRVSRANPRACRDDWQVLRQAGLQDLAVKEVAFLAAVNVFFNRAMTLPAVPVETVEELPERWFFRLARPFVGRMVRSRQRPGELVAKPVEADGPFAYLVRGLDRLPGARGLHAALQGAWGETVLSRRTKAMVFAVVARGLDCPLSEREAARLLVEEGLTPDDVEEVLTRLASPKLDEAESLIVPFARETIWYRPIQIQRRGRELRERLSNDQFVELVGVAALANTVCRMSVIVDPPQE
jgi:AhpD family alkylhydroperoxidase